MSCRSDIVEIEDVTVKKATDKALLVDTEMGEVWIPKSQLCEDSDELTEGAPGTLMIPQWLADEKGLT